MWRLYNRDDDTIMTRRLPTENSGDEYVQFRGAQTSVEVKGFGLAFGMTVRETPEDVPGIREHEPVPVVTGADHADPDVEVPRPAVHEDVAAELVEGERSNPLISYGVCCEWPDDDADNEFGVCGKVFDTPKALNGHIGSHYKAHEAASDDDPDGVDDDPEPDDADDTEDTDD